MRVLASTTANDGHAGPVFFLAAACLRAGHEVAVAAPASYAHAVQGRGFHHLSFADPDPALVGPVVARLPDLPFREADDTVVREIFGRIDAQAALPGLDAAITQWRPDVVLRDPAELGSLAAAEARQVPHVQVAIGMQELVRYLAATVSEPLDELGRIAGLPSGRLADALARETVLTPVPEALDRAGDPGYDCDLPLARYAGSAPAPTEPAVLPVWGDPEAPLVYVTFGSVAGTLPPFAGVFREALGALADDPVRVFLTAGRAVDLDGLGPVPSNAHVVPWWPQDDVLAHAAAVLGHGGFGTTYGAYARGVPQVVAPLFTFDQRVNGAHVAAVGAGRTVDVGPDVVTRAVAELRTLLSDATYLDAAREGRRQAAALPPPEAAVNVLEMLVG